MSKRRSGERPNILHGRKKTLPVNTATARRPEHGRDSRVNQGALAGSSAMALKRVCVSRGALFPTAAGGELRSLRVSVVVAILSDPIV